MQIEILQLLEGARRARGLAVIIDVFRAFSVACYAYGKGVRQIYPVGDIDEAFRLKDMHPDYLLVGERNERRPEGFDFGNSPSQLQAGILEGKCMIHTTSSGTRGIANAVQADERITGSFVNAGAILRYIRRRQPEVLSLVCMGYACSYPTDEDTMLAEYFRDLLEGREVDFCRIRERLRAGSGARFFTPGKQEWAPAADFELCLQLNRFDFVLRVEQENGRNVLRRIDM
ncbi:MAG: 2-phosphosulfolactate phosphatase [Mangrovibacterium sp.]